MLSGYFQDNKKRMEFGIPPFPLNVIETQELCMELEKENATNEALELFTTNITPGVTEEAKIKAAWLKSIALKENNSPVIDPVSAVYLLSTMVGGYNIQALIECLSNEYLGEVTSSALGRLIYVYDGFEKVLSMAKDNIWAEKTLNYWAGAEWFFLNETLPEVLTGRVYKVNGEITTDDLSPAIYASSRADIPLHALTMGEKRFPDGIKTIFSFREKGDNVFFAGDVVGTGSSRKSAINSLMWHLGKSYSYIPGKKTGAVILGGIIAPIFMTTVRDAGGLAIQLNVSSFSTGDDISINLKESVILKEAGIISDIPPLPPAVFDEYRAGGRLNLIVGKSLTYKARKVLGLPDEDFFVKVSGHIKTKENQGYTLAQKIVGKACGLKGVLPGMSCEPKVSTVGSQDTTGGMTMAELDELACLKFQTNFFLQTFCHTAPYPSAKDVSAWKSLTDSAVNRGGLALKPGDGIIHSWLNRMIVPDTVGTGGDSHTRFPIGISFPAGSGLVAFAAAFGFMPLEMPESVLVKFKGKLKEGLTIRDMVNSIPFFAKQNGLLTVEKKGKINIFAGRILEMEGTEDLNVEQAFELTDASAERSAAAATIALDKNIIKLWLKDNLELLEDLKNKDYQSKQAIEQRIAEVKNWLETEVSLKRDVSAVYSYILEIDLTKIEEPLLACPNDPDDIKTLSQVKDKKIEEVFIGSCMTNWQQFVDVAGILDGLGYCTANLWITPPTRMIRDKFFSEGFMSIFSKAGARMEIPGCSLCMGNQARVRPETTVVSTSTRNFDNRLGDNTKVYLTSSRLAAVSAFLGRLPSTDEYFKMVNF